MIPAIIALGIISAPAPETQQIDWRAVYKAAKEGKTTRLTITGIQKRKNNSDVGVFLKDRTREFKVGILSFYPEGKVIPPYTFDLNNTIYKFPTSLSRKTIVELRDRDDKIILYESAVVDIVEKKNK